MIGNRKVAGAQDPPALPSDGTCASCGGALAVQYTGVIDAQTREVFNVCVCARCRLGQTRPQPARLDPYYAEYHGARHGLTQAWCLRRRLSFVKSMGGSTGRALDIGCGDGAFLLALRNLGWAVRGSEFAPASARQAGLDVVEDLAEIPEGERFELITLWHSLEHMRDPRDVLAQAAALLAPGGVVLMAVPDAGSMQARVFGARWVHLDVPRHLFHFTESALTELLRTVGLTAVGTWKHEVELDLFGWTQSALNLVLPEPNVLFAVLTGHPTHTSRRVVAASFVLGAVLTAAAVPVVAAGVLCGDAGTLVVAARASR